MRKYPSKDYQYKTVSAGVALGLCMMQQHTIPANKLPLEFAFKRAWGRWKYKDEFPAMGKVFSLGTPTVDPYIALTSNNERTKTPRVPFYWDRGGLGYQIYGREGWDWDPSEQADLDFVADLLMDDPQIAASAWEDLARDMLAELTAKD